MDEDDVGVCEGLASECDGEVTFGPDPFASEIDGDDTPVWLCEEHYAQYAAEI